MGVRAPFPSFQFLKKCANFYATSQERAVLGTLHRALLFSAVSKKQEAGVRTEMQWTHQRLHW
jgi:hypothetical protein